MHEARSPPLGKGLQSDRSYCKYGSRMWCTSWNSASQWFHIFLSAIPGISADKEGNSILRQTHWKCATESHQDDCPVSGKAACPYRELSADIPEMYSNDYVCLRKIFWCGPDPCEGPPDTYRPSTLALRLTVLPESWKFPLYINCQLSLPASPDCTFLLPVPVLPRKRFLQILY